MFGETLTRRQLVIGAGATALIGALGLAGCGGDELVGKTLYSYPTTFSENQPDVDQSDLSTLTFNDEENWHYTGGIWKYVDELSGTWVREGENIVLTSSGAVGTITLNKMDGENGYSLVGGEGFGICFLPSEDEALDYSERYIEESGERVRELLESGAWDTGYQGITPPKAPTVEFGDGKIDYTKGEFNKSSVLRGPAEGDWEASDHAGEYDVKVTKLGSPNGVPTYSGTLAVGGESVKFELGLYDSYTQLALGDGWAIFKATK